MFPPPPGGAGPPRPGAHDLVRANAGERLLVQRQHLLAVLDENLAVAGQTQAAFAAIEKNDPGEFFEPPDLHADRRLGLVEFVRGFGEAGMIVDGDERAQEIQFEQGRTRRRVAALVGEGERVLRRRQRYRFFNAPSAPPDAPHKPLLLEEK